VYRPCIRGCIYSPFVGEGISGGPVDPGPWTPADIVTSAWLDASDTSPTNIIQSGGLVSQLTDKGTSGTRHLVQSTSGNRMSTGLETINGLNVLSSSVLDKFMQNSGFPMPASGNVCVSFVAQIDGQATNTNASLVSMDAANNDWQLNSNNASQFNGALNAVGSGSIIGTSDSLTGGPFTGPVVWTLQFNFDDNVKKVYTNGVERSSGTYNNKIDPSQLLRIFSNRAGLQSVFGLFGEMVIFEDISQCANVQTYLTDKWVP